MEQYKKTLECIDQLDDLANKIKEANKVIDESLKQASELIVSINYTKEVRDVLGTKTNHGTSGANDGPIEFRYNPTHVSLSDIEEICDRRHSVENVMKLIQESSGEVNLGSVIVNKKHLKLNNDDGTFLIKISELDKFDREDTGFKINHQFKVLEMKEDGVIIVEIKSDNNRGYFVSYPQIEEFFTLVKQDSNDVMCKGEFIVETLKEGSSNIGVIIEYGEKTITSLMGYAVRNEILGACVTVYFTEEIKEDNIKSITINFWGSLNVKFKKGRDHWFKYESYDGSYGRRPSDVFEAGKKMVAVLDVAKIS